MREKALPILADVSDAGETDIAVDGVVSRRPFSAGHAGHLARLIRNRKSEIIESMRKCLVAAILSLASALAQPPQSETPAGAITGVVRDSTTHAPLAGVRVGLASNEVVTDVQGRFTVPNIAPGLHWISANDEGRGAHGGVYALVTASQELSVEIGIKLGGTISGKVVDEDKNPVAGAAVLLLERRFEFGQMAYARHQTAIAGKDGEYRLAAVPPERSYLLLAKKLLGVPGERVFLPAYYPGYRYPQDAQPVVLTPGENRQAVDIRMASGPSYCIDGTVEGSSGRPLGVVAIMEHQALVVGSAFAAVNAKLTAGGKFRACGLHPGKYRLVAREGEGNVNRSDRTTAFAEVLLIDHDLTGLKLVAHPPSAVSVEAVWDPPPPGKAAETPIRVGLNKRIDDDRDAEGEGRPPSILSSFSYGGRVPVPGSFTIDRVPADEYELHVDALPAGCYVKEASYAGASLLHRLLRSTDGAGSRMRLVLACDGGSLTARVTGRDGNPVSHVSLYAMPVGAVSEAELRDGLESADVEKGWSAIGNPLPPGKYAVLACDLELDGTAEPILKLWRARSRAKEVEIGPNATVQVTLELSEVD